LNPSSLSVDIAALAECAFSGCSFVDCVHAACMTLMLLTETRANLFFVSVVFVQSLLILITSVNLDLENLFAWKLDIARTKSH